MTTTIAKTGSVDAMELLTVHLRIKRYNPEVDTKPHWEEFEVQQKASDTVLNALHNIKWTVDGTLSFRRSCAHGVCGSDAMVINGENKLSEALPLVLFRKG
jgi:succinate dehydrogenase / fumarate reductase iron-sulfur subunit